MSSAWRTSQRHALLRRLPASCPRAAPDKCPMQEPLSEELPEWGRWHSAPGGKGSDGKPTAMPRAWKGVGDRQVRLFLCFSVASGRLFCMQLFRLSENQVRKASCIVLKGRSNAPCGVQEDWGELYEGKRATALFVLDLKTWALARVRGLPAESSAALPIWDPEGAA